MKKYTLVTSFLAVALASCGREVPTQGKIVTHSESAFQTSSTAIAPSEAQALVLTAGLRTQAITDSNAHQVSLNSVLVDDFDGNPFYYLTLSTTDNIKGDFWTQLKSARKAHKIYGTGASQDRNLYAFEFGEDFGRRVLKLKNKIDFKQFVSPQGAIIYMQDQRGNFWDVASGERVDQNTIAVAREMYNELKADYFGHPDDVRAMRAIWQKVSAEHATQSPLGPLAKTVDQDGNLIVSQAIRHFNEQHLQAQGSANDAAGIGAFGWVQSRAGIAGTNFSGSVAMTRSDRLEATESWGQPAVPEWRNRFNTDYGNVQDATVAPYLQTAPAGTVWGIRYFNPFVNGVAPSDVGRLIGCVPTSLMRVITINSRNGNLTSQFQSALYNKYGHGWTFTGSLIEDTSSNLADMYKAMAKPEQADGTPAGFVETHISKMFGAGAFGNGVSVDAVGLSLGGPALINEVLGSRFYMVGAMRGSFGGLRLQQSFPYNTFGEFSYAVRDAVRQVINDDGNAVAFSYTPSSGLFTTSGHNAVSYAYRIYEYVGYSDVFVYLDQNNLKEGVGGDTGWINITNRWTSAQGAVGIRYR